MTNAFELYPALPFGILSTTPARLARPLSWDSLSRDSLNRTLEPPNRGSIGEHVCQQSSSVCSGDEMRDEAFRG